MTDPITLIPALSDNYIYLIQWNGEAAVVDPASADAVKKIIDEKEIELKYILVTHHHYDHTEGNEELKELTKCEIIGPNDERVAGLDRPVSEGEKVQVGPFEFEVISVPGHTSTHIAFFEPNKKWLFCGDSLFCGGCGRLFEGSPEEMHISLQKLCKLPEDTLVYCGHEYTVNNLEFALSIEPGNQEVMHRLESVKQAINEGSPSIPSTLASEIRTNPFLRVQDPNLRKALKMSNASDTDVFAQIRLLKDRF